MTERLGSAILELSTDDSKFTGGVNTAEKRAGGLEDKFKKTALAAGAIAVAFAAAASVLIKKSIDSADNFAKMSRSIGVSVESLSGLEFAAKLSGSSFEGLTKSLGRLARTASDADNGLATAKRGFDDLGISVTDSSGQLKGTEDILLEVADRFAQMEDGTKKAALAQELFGRSGLGLIPLLNQGAEGIRAMIDEGAEFGQVISTETAQAAEIFNDDLQKLGDSLTGVANTVIENILPMMVDFTGSLVTWVKESDAIPKAAAAIEIAFRTMVSTGQLVSGIFEFIGNAVGTLAAALLEIAQGEFTRAFDVMKSGFERSQEIAEGTIDGMVNAWEDGARDLKRPAEKTEQAFDDVLEVSEDLTKEQKELKKKIDKTVDAFKDAIRPGDDLAANLKVLEEQGIESGDIIKVYGDKIRDVIDEHIALDQKIPGTLAKLDLERRGIDTENISLDAQRTLLNDLHGERVDLEQQADDLRAKFDDERVALDFMNASLGVTESRMEALADPVDGLIGDYIDAQEDAAKKTDDVTTAVDGLATQVSTTFTNMAQGIADAIIKWEGLSTVFTNVAKEIGTAIVSHIIEKAMKPLNSLLDSVLGKLGGVFRD